MNELQLVSDCANPSYVASSSRKREATASVMDIPIVIYIYVYVVIVQQSSVLETMT